MHGWETSRWHACWQWSVERTSVKDTWRPEALLLIYYFSFCYIYYSHLPQICTIFLSHQWVLGPIYACQSCPGLPKDFLFRWYKSGSPKRQTSKTPFVLHCNLLWDFLTLVHTSCPKLLARERNKPAQGYREDLFTSCPLIHDGSLQLQAIYKPLCMLYNLWFKTNSDPLSQQFSVWPDPFRRLWGQTSFWLVFFNFKDNQYINP